MIKKIFEKIEWLLFLIFHPSYWAMNYKYNEAWNNELIQAMKTNNFILLSAFVAELGSCRVWIGNHPFSSFTKYTNHTERIKGRPNRKTIRKAYKKMCDDDFVYSNKKKAPILHIIK